MTRFHAMDGANEQAPAAAFEAERPRLVALAARILSDHAEAEDMVQQAWLRLQRQRLAPDNLPGWLTTVTSRLSLDRLRSKTPEPADELDGRVLTGGTAALSSKEQTGDDVSEDVVMAETVGAALQLVLDRLTPSERVAFVLHDSFGFDFPTIAAIIDTSPAAARKLASRARAKVRQPVPDDALADWEVVDAFMAAARGGDFTRLMQLLAPDATVTADAAAIEAGTPERIDGREPIAAFFNGSAKAALPVTVAGRPASAWFHRGHARVLFDFTIDHGVVSRICFRAAPAVLAEVTRRKGAPAAHD